MPDPLPRRHGMSLHKLDQIPQIPIQVFEHRGLAIIRGYGFAHELNAPLRHLPVIPFKIVGAEE